jgi:hypothetical protein
VRKPPPVLAEQSGEREPLQRLPIRLSMRSAQGQPVLCLLNGAPRHEGERHTRRRSGHPAHCQRRRQGRSMEADSHSHHRSAGHSYSYVDSLDR